MVAFGIANALTLSSVEVCSKCLSLLISEIVFAAIEFALSNLTEQFATRSGNNSRSGDTRHTAPAVIRLSNWHKGRPYIL